MVASANRFEEVIEVSPSGHLYQEYAILHNFVETRPELSYRRLRYALKALGAPPLKHYDSMFILTRLSEMHLEKGRLPEARKYIDLALATDSNDLAGNLLLVEYTLSQGLVAEYPDLALMLERRFPNQPRALMEAGLLWLHSGNVERGGGNLQRAYTLDTAYAMAALNYGIYLCRVEDYLQAAEVLVGAVARHTAGPTTQNLIAVADSALKSAGAVTTGNEAQGRIQALRTRLDSLVSSDRTE
jgi:predicted Zn-dependent protease